MHMNNERLGGKIYAVDDETSVRIIEELKEEKGDEAVTCWKERMPEVRQAIEGEVNQSIRNHRIIGIAREIGTVLDVPTDAGGTDAGARGLEFLLQTLEKILGDGDKR